MKFLFFPLRAQPWWARSMAGAHTREFFRFHCIRVSYVLGAPFGIRSRKHHLVCAALLHVHGSSHSTIAPSTFTTPSERRSMPLHPLRTVCPRSCTQFREPSSCVKSQVRKCEVCVRTSRTARWPSPHHLRWTARHSRLWFMVVNRKSGCELDRLYVLYSQFLHSPRPFDV